MDAEDVLQLIVGIFLIVVFVDALAPIVMERLQDAFGFWGMVGFVIVIGIIGSVALIDSLSGGGGR